MANRDYYEVLGVSRNNTEEDITTSKPERSKDSIAEGNSGVRAGRNLAAPGTRPTQAVRTYAFGSHC